MNKNPQNQEKNNEKIKNDDAKKSFFKKVWYSIDKIEKYSELSAEGFKSAIKYLGLLIMTLCIISSIITVYKTSLEIKNIAQYINEKSPEITYKDGMLQVDSQETIIDENSMYGKVIIDTVTDSEEKINEYINQVSDEKNTIIILKNKLIIKQIGIRGISNYEYKALFGEMGINEFNKQQIVDYLTSSNMMPLYLNLCLALFIYAFVIYFINTIFYILVIAMVGYITTILLKLKIRFIAVFNMAVYAITLPIILNIIYLIINAFYKFTINYFDILYVLVSSIYIIAALFILKTDFNKKEGEVQKIVEVQTKIKEEMEEEQKEENKEENKDTQKKDKNNKETKDDNIEGEEPEGSNA